MGVYKWILFLAQELNQMFMDTFLFRMEQYIKFRIRVSKVTEVVISVMVKRNAIQFKLFAKAVEELILFQIGFTGVCIASNINDRAWVF